MVEGVGFEPTYAKRPDLQSGGFNHSPTPPREERRRENAEADAPFDGPKTAFAAPGPPGERGL